MQKINKINLLGNLPDASKTEQFENLFSVSGCRFERIVSYNQASPPGFWYEQAWDEWVMLLSGNAILRFEEQESVSLQASDCLLIPALLRHRVESTDDQQPTVWLAIHFPSHSA